VPRSTVVIELAGDATLSRDLAAGGVFVRGYALRIAEECELVVCGAHRRVSLPARVVYIDEQRGAGLELIGFSNAMREQLAELTADHAAAAPDDDLALPSDCHIELSGGDDVELHVDPDDDLAVPIAHDDDHRTVPVHTDGHAAAAVPIAQDDDRDTTPVSMPVASAPRELVLPLPPPTDSDAFFDVVKVEDRFAAGDAASGFDDDFHKLDEPEPMLASDVRSEFDDDFAATGDPVPMRAGDAAALSNDFTDGDDAAAIVAGDAATLGNDFDDSMVDQGEPVPMQPGDAAARGNDFDDEPSPITLEPDPDPDDEPEPVPVPEPEPEPEDAGSRLATGSRGPRNVHERLRGLNLAAQIKLATSGELHERIVLERLYGKNVWETLLRNPRLTAPEVSRIARYGSLPRVLLELILANNAWLQVPEVRRALLSNPRLGNDQIVKVLRLTPKHELKLAAVQTAYPHAVRNAAKMLLRSE
jgi:hypothetical protein